MTALRGPGTSQRLPQAPQLCRAGCEGGREGWLWGSLQTQLWPANSSGWGTDTQNPISSWQATGAFPDVSAPMPKTPNKAVVGVIKWLLPESDSVSAQPCWCHTIPSTSSRDVSATRTTPGGESPAVLSPLLQPGPQLHTKRCSLFMSGSHKKLMAREKHSWSRTSCGRGR